MLIGTIQTCNAQFFRHPAIAGAELRLVEGQKQEWGFYSQGYQVVFSRDWSGKVWHRREHRSWDPRTVLLTAPGQLVLTTGCNPGQIASLTLSTELMTSLVSPEQLAAFEAGAELTLAPEVLGVLLDLSENGTLWLCPASIRSRVEFIINGLVQGRADQPRPLKVRRAPADAVISRIDVEEAVSLDLETLSSHTGTSRFAALRAFKRHFGLPPHTFQLQMRVDQAQAGLRAGHTPAQVAVDCGFFDQSHLTRHFKRILGTTPAQYARGHVPVAVGIAQ